MQRMASSSMGGDEGQRQIEAYLQQKKKTKENVILAANNMLANHNTTQLAKIK